MSPRPTALPLAGGDAKREYVREVFAAIAPRYDLLNRVLSLKTDTRWRRTAVDRLGWPERPEGRYLDCCAGTLDLAAELAEREAFRGRVIAADLVPEMLHQGRDKSAAVLATAADALRLPFGDGVFDGAMVGFGVRNLMDLDAGLRELARVLRPGMRLVILEFTTPRRQPLRGLYLGYFRRILPRIGRLVSRHGSAYDYLPASVLAFPEPPALAARLEAAGFGNVTWQTRWGGIVAIHTGERLA